jgi:hypothetical protein
MTRARLALAAVVALIITLGIGYAWGASGRAPLSAALEDTRQQLDIAEARGHLLDARVSLYNVNFGAASRHFEAAKAPLARVQKRYEADRNTAAAASVGTALDRTAEAQRLAGNLDQTANAKAGEALEAIKSATGK